MEKPLVNNMRENYGYFGGLSLIYGLLFAFCIYKNTHGVTFIIYAAATVVFAVLFMKKIGFHLQKKTKRYFIGMMLLSIAMIFTTDFFFIAFNWIGMLLLFGVAMIHQFYNDGQWNFPAYLQRLFILFGTAIGLCFFPFKHGVQYLTGTDSGKKKTVYAILIGFLVALGLLVVILPLLLRSDMVFATFFGDILKYINLPTIFGVGVTVILGFTACYAFFSSLCSYNFPVETERKLKYYNPIVGITFTSVLGFIYMLYCGIQILYLFLGLDKGLPSAVTYSEYARSGFWELLFVSIINFVLVLICMYVFTENKVLKGVLTFISGCTYIMLISAAYRMLIYVGQYDLTFLRVLVMWFLLVLALIMGGVIVSIFRKSFPLFRYIMMIVAICYITFALSRPNYWIVQYNVAHAEEMSYSDIQYLMVNFPEDAASAIAEIDPEAISEGADSSRYYQFSTKDIKGGLYDYFYNLSNNNEGVYFRKANYVRIRAKLIADDYLEQHKDYEKYSNRSYSSYY